MDSGEHLTGSQEVSGSIPLVFTIGKPGKHVLTFIKTCFLHFLAIRRIGHIADCQSCAGEEAGRAVQSNGPPKDNVEEDSPSISIKTKKTEKSARTLASKVKVVSTITPKAAASTQGEIQRVHRYVDLIPAEVNAKSEERITNLRSSLFALDCVELFTNVTDASR